MAALIIFGLFFGNQSAFGHSLVEVHQTAGNFGVAILATLFAFDGWILVANLGGEIKNPRKLLPQAITLGILAVLVIYLLVSYGVYRSVPAEQIHKLGTSAIPYIANQAFGAVGGKILSIGIIISIVGCMNGKIMTFPRIMYAMAKRGQLPFSKTLSYLHPKSHTPIFFQRSLNSSLSRSWLFSPTRIVCLNYVFSRFTASMWWHLWASSC